MVDSHHILILVSSSEVSLALELRQILLTSFESEEVVTEMLEASDLSSLPAKVATLVSKYRPDVVFVSLPIIDVSAGTNIMRDGTGIPTIRCPVLVIGKAVEPTELFSTLELGATDFVTLPLRATDVLPRVWRLIHRERSPSTPVGSPKARMGLKQIIGKSPAFLDAVKKIPAIARADASVLISGETGTGKEVCARAIHYVSLRAYKPFVPVNCGAIPVELMENELFGHEKGAFTGAHDSQPGLVHEARGGTLFLDEIDCLSLPAQVKLLRFLQSKEYRRLGSNRTLLADLRVIAASNADIEKAVTAGTLREDLYYRLNIVPLHIPPLRARQLDIPLLAEHFLRKFALGGNRGEMRLMPCAVRKLLTHEWPGNVRELEHVVERAVVLSEAPTITEDEIQFALRGTPTAQDSFQAAKSKVVAEFERTYIQGLLVAYRGNISESARAAKKNRRAFFQLVRKHQIDVRQFR